MTELLPNRTRRKTALSMPKPTRRGNIKVTREGWLTCARYVLIEEGIAAVKVDRLAKRLSVTRGSFYSYFKSHKQLLDELLDTWQREDRFIPPVSDLSTPQAAAALLERTNVLWVTEFDDRFDTAIRAWGSISSAVAAVVHQVDDDRMRGIYHMMLGLGYGEHEALIRARVFYYHQIGYYALGVSENTETRLANLPTYVTVLCGPRYIDAIQKE